MKIWFLVHTMWALTLPFIWFLEWCTVLCLNSDTQHMLSDDGTLPSTSNRSLPLLNKYKTNEENDSPQIRRLEVSICAIPNPLSFIWHVIIAYGTKNGEKYGASTDDYGAEAQCTTRHTCHCYKVCMIEV